MSKEISEIINNLRINIESIDIVDKGGIDIGCRKISNDVADTIRRIELFLNEPVNKKEIIGKALDEISNEKTSLDLDGIK